VASLQLRRFEGDAPRGGVLRSSHDGRIRVIVVDLADLKQQVVLTPNMQKAIEFLEASTGKQYPDGRVVVDGDNVFTEVQSYDTVEGGEVRFEGHRKYLDIQYVLEGEEIIAWASRKDVNETKAYDAEGDYWLGSAPADKVTNVRLSAGQLAVLYPNDAHAPRRAAGASSAVKKFVVKVALD
jgi:YhcH/YjgK/YiaL family protein